MKGMMFDNIHSFRDLNLVLSSVMIPPATVKTNFVNNPCGDGSWDLTEALGQVNYTDRTCTFVFSVLPTDDFEVKKKEISNLLNGRRFKIVLDKDPGYYWNGRISVNSYETQKKKMKITLGAVVAPYKLKTDVTQVSVQLTSTPKEITLLNSRKTVSPEIICTESAKLVVDGNEFNISQGTHKILDFQLHEGVNTVTISGTGKVTFVYQEGDL